MFNAMFEVADVWCYGMSAPEYIDVLRLLYDVIGLTDERGVHRLRGMTGAVLLL